LVTAESEQDPDEFLRSVNHELRTPLNSILGFSELLLSDVEGRITDGQRENLEVVQRSGQRLLAMFAELEEERPLTIDSVVAKGHDLLNVLGAVVGFADLLVSGDADPLSEPQRTCVDRIRVASEDLRALLDQLVEWARVEAGRVQLSMAPVSVPEVVGDVMQQLARRAAGRSIRLVQSVAPDLPKLTADRRRLVQALMGLLDHAVRAGGTEQAVKLRVVPDQLQDPTRAAVRFDLVDPTLQLRDLDRFLQPERPSFAPSGKRIAGMGVGAALARALLHLHDGHVSVVSRPTGGTTFRVLLPAAG
jgi:signal transduction histidine kinase